MQSNGDKKLDSVAGKRSDVRRSVHNAIFGKQWTDNQVKHIRNNVFSECPAFIVQYFESCLQSPGSRNSTGK